MAGVGVGGGSPLMRGGTHGQPGEVPPLGAGPSVDTMRFVASIKVDGWVGSSGEEDIVGGCGAGRWCVCIGSVADRYSLSLLHHS